MKETLPQGNFEVRPEDAGRMSMEDAQEEANMLRARLHLNPNDGFMLWGQGNPTPEDYAKASLQVEEVIANAEKESSSTEFLLKAMRFVELLGYGFSKAIGSLDASSPGYKYSEEHMEREHQRMIQKLKSAKDRLADLKNRAEEYKNLPSK
jgi:hypothetical protein